MTFGVHQKCHDRSIAHSGAIAFDLYNSRLEVFFPTSGITDRDGWNGFDLGGAKLVAHGCVERVLEIWLGQSKQMSVSVKPTSSPKKAQCTRP